jgi:hypothetical protein
MANHLRMVSILIRDRPTDATKIFCAGARNTTPVTSAQFTEYYITLMTYNSGKTSKIVMFPVSVDRDVMSDATHSDASRRVVVVMVPVVDSDVATLPNLRLRKQCDNADPSECLKREITARVESSGMERCLVLRSDGSLVWLRSNELWLEEKHEKEQGR